MLAGVRDMSVTEQRYQREALALLAISGEQMCPSKPDGGLFAITILTNADLRVVWRSTEGGGDSLQAGR